MLKRKGRSPRIPQAIPLPANGEDVSAGLPSLRSSRHGGLGWFRVGILMIICLLFIEWNLSRVWSIVSIQEEMRTIESMPGANTNYTLSAPLSLPVVDGAVEGREPLFREGSFRYANQTYSYRYSSKIHSAAFRRRYHGHVTNASGLPAVAYGVCANAAKPVRRNAIRRSWAKKSMAHPIVFFLVAGDWENILKEFNRTGDLLWIDIPEDYRDALTPKTFGFVHFGATHLAKALEPKSSSLSSWQPLDYLFKTDDDVYLNTTEIQLELLDSQLPDYFGLARQSIQPIRNKPESKWFLSNEDYPQEFFPIYAHGTGYALSMKFAQCAASQAMGELLRPMPWEDVATGILAEKCHVSLTASDKYWSHFVPFGAPTSEWEAFPYERFKDGNVTVKILHKVKPWFFEPLSQRASLVSAREYGDKKHEAKRKRVRGQQG